MDSNEKRIKRPRIGAIRPAETENDTNTGGESEFTGERREYNRYQGQRQYNSYNRQSNYNNRYPRQHDNYQPRRRYDATMMDNTDGQTTEDNANYRHNNYHNNDGYRSYDRQNNIGYRQQGGYNNRQGGYNNRQNNGGYNNRRPQGGYNNRPAGYADNDSAEGFTPNWQPRPYGNNRTQNGYNNYRQGGGYNNRQRNYNNRRPTRHNEFGMPDGGKSFVPSVKRIEYEQPIHDPDEQIRLNKFMANAGICSRREADEYIEKGLVKVNGEVITELGTKIHHNDTVEFNGKIVTMESKCYILLNKPKDCVTTADDPNGRLTVMDLVKNACEERIYPVGRLDRNTTGVLLLTNDGDLASMLTHPKFVKKKIYHVWTDRDISEDDMQRIADGIELEDGPIHADAISYATDTDRNQAGIEIHSGRNRIVRRIFESLGYHVTKLDRVYFAGLTKKNLPRGRWRYLTQEEVNYLKMGSFE